MDLLYPIITKAQLVRRSFLVLRQKMKSSGVELNHIAATLCTLHPTNFYSKLWKLIKNLNVSLCEILLICIMQYWHLARCIDEISEFWKSDLKLPEEQENIYTPSRHVAF